MFVVDVPDILVTNVQNHEFDQACTNAFAPTLKYQNVESWSNHVWVATFEDSTSAGQAKGKQIRLRDIAVTAEHLYERPPATFICDVSSVKVGEDEVALQIARTFSRSTVKPTLRRQEAPKLYSGCQYIVIIPKDLRLFRFYVPIPIRDSREVFIACFKPLNVTAPCNLCGAKHGKVPCVHSKSIALPMLS